MQISIQRADEVLKRNRESISVVMQMVTPPREEKTSNNGKYALIQYVATLAETLPSRR